MKIVITRHSGLVDYLIDIGLIDQNTPVIAHATAEDVRDKHVIGVLPLSLAALAASITELPLALPPELRGVELTSAEVRQFGGAPITYVVTRQSRRKT